MVLFYPYGTYAIPEISVAGTNDEQFRILRWLDEVRGRVRVVSTTGIPVWPRVQAGEFNEVLYYRLNTVFVDMGSI